jgi:hypothetical protein
VATVPGICDECGSVFGAEALTGAEGRNIKLGGARVGSCSSCGGEGSVPEGVFDLVMDTLHVVEMAAIEKVAFDAVIEVLEGRANGEVSDEEVIERAEEKVPGLVPTIKDYLSRSDPASWLALLISALMFLQSPTAPPSAEEIAHEIWSQKQQEENRAERREAPKAPAKKKVRKGSPKTHGKAKHRQSRKRR